MYYDKVQYRNHLAPQVYAHIRGVSAIQGVWIRVVSAIQGYIWIRGVSAIHDQGSGLEGCLQFRGLY